MRKTKDLSPIGDPGNPESLYYYMLRFLEWLKIHNYSHDTVETRQSYLRKFIKWCDDRGIGCPQEVTKPILERFQRYLFLHRKKNGKPLSISGQLAYLHSIRVMFRWLAKSNYILYNPASDLELPKKTHRLPKYVLTKNEVETIINQADTSTAFGLRDRAIMEVFYSTGIRRTELTNLKVIDIDIDRGTLMVIHGKGAKDRMIPIGQRALDWVCKYLDEVRPGLVIGLSKNILFLNQVGTKVGADYLTHLISDYISDADIGKKGSCHLFRHAMATLMLENGADIRYIQAILGHASLETTQIYTHLSIRKLKEIHTATHPAKPNKETKTKDKGEQLPPLTKHRETPNKTG